MHRVLSITHSIGAKNDDLQPKLKIKNSQAVKKIGQKTFKELLVKHRNQKDSINF